MTTYELLSYRKMAKCEWLGKRTAIKMTSIGEST